jgi:hypothetical protein
MTQTVAGRIAEIGTLDDLAHAQSGRDQLLAEAKQAPGEAAGLMQLSSDSTTSVTVRRGSR